MFWQHGILPFFWALGILILCLMPASDFPNSTINGMDKIVHAVLFCVLAFLMHTFFQRQYTVAFLRSKPMEATLSFCVFFGAFIELLQASFVVNRNGDLVDLLADIAGVGIGLLLFRWVHGKFVYVRQ